MCDFLCLQRHYDNGKVRLPLSFAPVFANSYMAVVFNHTIARENMAELGLYVVHFSCAQAIRLYFCRG